MYVQSTLDISNSKRLSGVSPGSKLCQTFLKIAKHYKMVAVRLRLILQFTYVQYCLFVSKTATDQSIFKTVGRVKPNNVWVMLIYMYMQPTSMVRPLIFIVSERLLK